jgi:S-adenosylmethionine hydrolase
MKPNKLMTLLTDLRHEDCFVGTLKGVLLRRQPQARIVDLSHGVPPGDIRAGAFALAAACRYFPRGTIHVAIVDPGVGGARPAIMVGTDEFFFVGPDNGLLSLALRRGKVRRIHRLGNPRYFPDAVSRTFHGRDIFAPVAAHLSRGVPGHRFGSEQRGFQQLPWPELYQHGGAIHGEILYVDRFGNAISNLGNELGDRGGWGGCACEAGGCAREASSTSPFHRAGPSRCLAPPASLKSRSTASTCRHGPSRTMQ